MEITEISNVIIAALGTIYLPLWVFNQTRKDSRSKEISSEIVQIKLMLKETTVRHEERLNNHETRIGKLEDVA